MAINTGASPVYEQLFGNELNLPGGRGQLYDVYILGQWQNPLNPGLTPGRIANVRGSNDYYFSPYHYKPGPGVPDVWVKVSFPAYKRDSG